MGYLWLPNATKYDIGDHAPCNTDDGAKAIAHITADRNASATKPQALVPFKNLFSYFTGSGKSLAPHLLWNPFTGDIAQFLPANSRSKSLKDLVGGVRTNRAGSVVIQVEALFFPYCTVENKTYARLVDTPCRNWETIQNWTHSWDVPNKWPLGVPTSFKREEISGSKYAELAGWLGHSQVPENNHVDPGSWPSFIVTTPVEHKTIPVFPGRQYFHVGTTSKYTTQVDNQLVRLKFVKHHAGKKYVPGPYYSENTRLNVRDFQHSRGWTGSNADGLVGPQTWHDLHAL